MEVSLTATGGLERRLEVAVPATEVAGEVEQRLKSLSRTVRLNGFRRGKAPLTVVRKQFADQVHVEVVNDLMRSSFVKALSQEKLSPAGDPRIEPITIAPGSELKYAAVFEVIPDIKLKPLQDIRLERPVSSVSDDDVSGMIESMRRQRPVFTPVERPAHDTDRVTLDYDGLIDGKPFEGGDGREVLIIVGSHQSLDQLEEAVKGATAGATRAVTLSFPAEHPNKEIAGRTAELQLTIKRVEEQSLPVVDEAFCRAYGVESGDFDALRAEVRSSMERELGDVIRNRMRVQVMDALYRENPVEVPKALVDEQVQRLQLDAARRAGTKDVNQLPPRESLEEPARRRAVLGLVMSQILQAEAIAVDRDRVMARLNEAVANYPQPEEARRAYLQNTATMQRIEASVLEDQVVEQIVSRAQITDKPFTFKELTGFGQEVAEHE